MRKVSNRNKWVVLLLCLTPLFAIAQSKPNIVFILVDDLGYAELGSDGNNFNETPHLDRLAAGGKKFTEAYAAAPVCSPTRASLMTGQYPARVRITDFLGSRPSRYLDPEKYTTINEALSQQGYHTGIVGKWHLDTDYQNPTAGPSDHGFDEVIGSETKYIADGDYFFPYDKNGTYTTGAPNEYLTDRQNADACDFIRRNKEKPFFLYLSYYSVHTRLDAPKETIAKYKKKFDEKYGKGSADQIFKAPRYQAKHVDNPYLAAMLEHIDDGVGMIMQTLKEQGLEQNTIVVFMSDNGGAPNVANNGNLRASKGWLYEGGIKVPLLIHWPSQVQPGVVNDLVSTIDFYPTFVAAAGGDIRQYAVDGENLLPLLTKGTALNRNEMYWHYPAETLKWTEKMSTVVRQGKYKLIKFYIDDRYELYDLSKDPSEKKNLAAKNKVKVREMSALMEKWKKEVGAEMPDAEALKKAAMSVETSTDERVTLLTRELGLSADQSKELRNIFHDFFMKQEELRRLPESRPRIVRQNARTREERLREILTPQQRKKLAEVRQKEIAANKQQKKRR